MKNPLHLSKRLLVFYSWTHAELIDSLCMSNSSSYNVECRRAFLDALKNPAMNKNKQKTSPRCDL